MLGADREAMNREREIISGSAAVCFNTPEETATASDGKRSRLMNRAGNWSAVGLTGDNCVALKFPVWMAVASLQWL